MDRIRNEVIGMSKRGRPEWENLNREKMLREGMNCRTERTGRN